MEWRCVDANILVYASLQPPSASLLSKFKDLALRFPAFQVLEIFTKSPGLS